MKKITLLFSVFLGFSSLAQPANDLCSNAIDLTIQSSSQECNPVTYTNEASTVSEAYDLSCAEGLDLNSVWFKFTTNASQTKLKITLNNMTTDEIGGDFLLDCAGTMASDLSTQCFGGDGNMQEIITGFTGNTTYYFRAGNFESEGSTLGTFGLCIREYVTPPPPVNDSCSAALQLFFDVAYNFNTEGSSTDAITADGDYIYEDAWFKFTAPFNTTYDVTTCGSDYDTKIAIYQASNCSSITDESHVAYNDDDDDCVSNDLNSFAQFVGTAGVDYYIRVGGFESGDAGDSRILITHPQAGVNEKDLVDFSMAPNPASNNVVLNFDGADKKQISLVDLTGKVISEIEINANQHTLDVSSLNKGIYIVKVSSAGGEVIKKLIKE
jgi:hypothetical protein